MGRILATLTLTFLAACDSSDYTYNFQRVTVVVENQGWDTANGDVREWGSSDATRFSIAPRDSMSFDLVVSYRLKVHIERASDHNVLLDDFWDAEDLDKMDNVLRITVVP